MGRTGKALKHFFLIACVLLMLLLPMLNLANNATANNNAGQPWQAQAFHPGTGMTSDIGLASSAFSRDFVKYMKAAQFMARTRSASQQAFRVVAENAQGLSAILFRNVLRTTQIHVTNLFIPTPFGGRAPPLLF